MGAIRNKHARRWKSQAEIGLPTAERVREYFSYDPETGELRWKKGRGPARVGELAGHIGPEGYREVRFDGLSLKGHRIAWVIMTGDWPSEQVDHKDGRRGNNAWSNLRAATVAENNRNGRCRGGAVGYKGVTQHAKSRFFASICVDRGIRYLGSFATAEDAARAYDDAAIKLHGEFAALNFPRPGYRNARDAA